MNGEIQTKMTGGLKWLENSNGNYNLLIMNWMIGKIQAYWNSAVKPKENIYLWADNRKYENQSNQIL